MTKNIGIDIVEFEEIEERLTDKFIHRILSAQELERFYKIKKTNDRIRFLAGRFAAKEAYTKVYKRFDTPLNFTDVSIINDQFGAPYLKSTYRPNDKVLISISHSRKYVVAVAVLEESDIPVPY